MVIDVCEWFSVVIQCLALILLVQQSSELKMKIHFQLAVAGPYFYSTSQTNLDTF